MSREVYDDKSLGSDADDTYDTYDESLETMSTLTASRRNQHTQKKRTTCGLGDLQTARQNITDATDAFVDAMLDTGDTITYMTQARLASIISKVKDTVKNRREKREEKRKLARQLEEEKQLRVEAKHQQDMAISRVEISGVTNMWRMEV